MMAKKDIMLSPGNAALILIDYQPPQISTVESIDRQTLINNVVALCKTAKLYELPIILSTVNVSNLEFVRPSVTKPAGYAHRRNKVFPEARLLCECARVNRETKTKERI